MPYARWSQSERDDFYAVVAHRADYPQEILRSGFLENALTSHEGEETLKDLFALLLSKKFNKGALSEEEKTKAFDALFRFMEEAAHDCVRCDFGDI